MKRLAISVLLSALILSMFGCGDVSQDSITENTPLSPPAIGDRIDPGYFDLLDELEYEVMSATYDPEFPAFMVAFAETWPGQPMFSIMIPEGACSEPVDFTMQWPKYESYITYGDSLAYYHQGDSPPLILRLGPDGEQFDLPLTIDVHWMTWEDLPESMQPFNVYSDSSEWEDIGYEVGGGVTIEPSGRFYYRIQFQVDHFSDWETGPEPGIRPPIIIH